MIDIVILLSGSRVLLLFKCSDEVLPGAFFAPFVLQRRLAIVVVS